MAEFDHPAREHEITSSTAMNHCRHHTPVPGPSLRVIQITFRGRLRVSNSMAPRAFGAYIMMY